MKDRLSRIEMRDEHERYRSAREDASPCSFEVTHAG
jgi:hypothetical protein